MYALPVADQVGVVVETWDVLLLSELKACLIV
jgi:hypothetical protein